MEESVTVVVPTFRRSDALATSLQALVGLASPAPAEIIVVDNAGEDETRRVVEAVRERAPHVRYASEPRGGAATARNHGAALAEGRWLLFCDDDIVPLQDDHVARHLLVHAQHPRALVGGAWTFSPQVRSELAMTPFGRFRIELEESFDREISGRALEAGRLNVPFISSCDLSVERALFEELAGFDEAFPYAGAEDQDLSLRARAAGCALVYDRSITLHHNDRRLSLEAFCTREERSAQTAVVLARNFPHETGQRPLVVENAPGVRGEPWRLRAKKAAKRLLSNPPGLWISHRLAAGAERLGVGDGVLARIYRAAIALHIFHGVRVERRAQND
jgi:GT2 family glycosyltransferase